MAVTDTSTDPKLGAGNVALRLRMRQVIKEKLLADEAEEIVQEASAWGLNPLTTNFVVALDYKHVPQHYQCKQEKLVGYTMPIAQMNSQYLAYRLVVETQSHLSERLDREQILMKPGIKGIRDLLAQADQNGIFTAPTHRYCPEREPDNA